MPIPIRVSREGGQYQRGARSHDTRTAKVRIELPNPKGIMRAGMFVTATFKGQQLIERVVIPASAIVHLHDKDWVFVPAGRQAISAGRAATGTADQRWSGAGDRAA